MLVPVEQDLDQSDLMGHEVGFGFILVSQYKIRELRPVTSQALKIWNISLGVWVDNIHQGARV